jgi:ParB family chromosome partitioning protein
MRHDRHFVDELTQRMGEGIGRMIRVSAITSNQDQPRTNLGDLEDLVASITTHGVLEPLLVRRHTESPGYELISGERRFHAAVQAGLTEVPCIELEVSDEHALEIALIENLQRQDLSAFEEAEGYRTLVEKYSYSHEQVATAVGRSRVTVTESLKLLSVPAAIRSMCRHADITAKGILLEIARLDDEDSMAALIQEIVEERLDRGEVRARRRELENQEPSANGDAGEDHDQPGTPTGAAARRPFIVRFRPDDRRFTVSLSFRTEREPEPTEVIAALEEMIRGIRADLQEARDD